ncbi:hypothetical protein DUNSADRAFT_17960 [Dunaliella salina]|uniref:Uncharacterized protein n=1 Tax=Dunaliella salina TaxID=3046 RepID=A0ABQ7GZL0_DUNSA|nr:hypothetical protein DUNSADRAFT_17960 [Dunaliella salina]|eukprot:KAF5840043.1 hypothetical protein DUNSADRAFT_17960 [Dunaliella salina]
MDQELARLKAGGGSSEEQQQQQQQAAAEAQARVAASVHESESAWKKQVEESQAEAQQAAEQVQQARQQLLELQSVREELEARSKQLATLKKAYDLNRSSVEDRAQGAAADAALMEEQVAALQEALKAREAEAEKLQPVLAANPATNTLASTSTDKPVDFWASASKPVDFWASTTTAGSSGLDSRSGSTGSSTISTTSRPLSSSYGTTGPESSSSSSSNGISGPSSSSSSNGVSGPSSSTSNTRGDDTMESPAAAQAAAIHMEDPFGCV